jgi:hypothetical protein
MEYKELKNRQPEPRIFWEFIKKERDSILKQYRTSAGQGVTIDLEENKTTYEYVINEGVLRAMSKESCCRKQSAFGNSTLERLRGSMSSGKNRDN